MSTLREKLLRALTCALCDDGTGVLVFLLGALSDSAERDHELEAAIRKFIRAEK